MNVTENGFKNRQLHKEDYLQMVSAEQKEHAEGFVHSRITENNDVITDFQTDNLMEQILELVLIGFMHGFSNTILTRARRKSESILSYGELFQRSNR